MDRDLVEKNIVASKLKNANKINPRLKEMFVFLVKFEYFMKFGEMI